MARAKKNIPYPGRKDCWHIYSLQDLTPAKFIDVVNRFLKGRCSLITSKHGILDISRDDHPK